MLLDPMLWLCVDQLVSQIIILILLYRLREYQEKWDQ